MQHNLIKHLRTVSQHRKYVRKSCFKMGLYYQGLVHDLSKYSLKELSIAKYYTGTCSPHKQCRDTIGYSPSWMNHYHKNKHHWQYWLDMEDWPDKIIAVKMPYKYVVESFCDFIGAGKAYEKTKWTTSTPYTYWIERCEGKRLMHKDSEKLMKDLLKRLSECKTEKDFYNWYKKNKKELKKGYELC